MPLLLAAGLALFVGFGGAVALDRTLLREGAADDLTDAQICGGSVISDTGAVKRNLPKTTTITSTWSDFVRDDKLRERCIMWADDAIALRLTASLEKGSVTDWERQVKSETPDAGGQEMVFNAGGKAVSRDKDAAIYLPCTLPGKSTGGNESNARTYLSVVAHGAGSAVEQNDKRRQDLAYLASQVAGRAHSAMGCKEPLNIPDGVPKVGSAH